MCDNSEFGVLYTEHSGLIGSTPIASLWSYETRIRGRNRRAIAANSDGSHEYWLERSDPLLNTILPGTSVSVVVNFGELWAAGRSLVMSECIPRACVIGPVTQARILDVGRSVQAVGAVVPPTVASGIFGVPAVELVDRIVPLQDLWPRDDAARLFASIGELDVRRRPSALRDALVARHGEPHSDGIAETASRLIQLRAGRVSIDRMARIDGLSRQEFARRFCAAAGLPPKLFARITRFQALIHVLLSTDVSRWAFVAPAVGFYDQAHMINEFRAFAGSPPTIFFRPHGGTVDPAHVQLRGRPSEWLQRTETAETDAVPRPPISNHRSGAIS